MKITAIIPIYNAEKYLDKLLISIQQQTYKNYEVIMVNDGSTDNSLEIIKKYENDKMKYITIENSGPGIARREGFKLATGDLLFFIDSDDFIPNKHAFERINQIYQENKFDIMLFTCILKYENKETKSIPIKNISRNLEDGLYSCEYLKNHMIGPGVWDKIFVKNKMTIDNFCDANNYEDTYTVFTYLNNCNNFYFSNEVFYYSNRDLSNSLSKIMNTKKIFKTVDLLKEIYNKTNYKLVFSKVIYEWYTYLRMLIDRDKTNINNKEEKQKQIKKLKELKDFYNERDLFKTKLSPKDCIKYCYFKIKNY